MNVGILGSGIVAQTLAAGFLKHGHAVLLGTRDTGKLAGWHRDHPDARLGSVAQAAGFGELLVLAVKGDAAPAVQRAAGPALGGVEAARAIEPLCILWCIPGFLRNEWTHAFKVLHA